MLYGWLNSDPGIEFDRMSGVLKKYNDILMSACQKDKSIRIYILAVHLMQGQVLPRFTFT